MSEQDFELEEQQETRYRAFWIYDNQIAGSSDLDIPPDQWAAGFRLVAVPDRWEERLCYWDAEAQEVKLKGDRPSDDAIWNSETNEWTVPAPPPPPEPMPQWEQLTSALRGSAVFQRGYMGSEVSVAVNAAFTLLINALTTLQNLNDLRFAFGRLRATLSETTIGDFTAVELEAIEQKLLQCHFDPGEFELG